MSSPAVLTGPPVVTLRSATARPYDGAIAAARTCYSPRVVVPDGIAGEARAVFDRAVLEAWEDYRRLTELLGQDTLRIVSDLRHLSCLLYTSPSPRDRTRSRMPSSA